MDEADTLADRVVIMSEGEVRCSGTPLFLKTRFGVGYLLSISKTDADVLVGPIHSLVKEVVSTATIVSSVAGEVIFRLPLDSISLFAELLTKVKDNSTDLMISSYGISFTSLEQVFLSLAKEKIARKHNQQVDDYDDHTDEFLFHWRRYILDLWFSICCMKFGTRTNESELNVSRNADRYPILSQILERLKRLPGSKSSYTQLGNNSNHSEESQEKGEVGVTISHNVTPTAIVIPTTVLSGSSDTTLSGGSKAYHTLVQYYELIRKRFIIASRDLKGMFFQVVFPAIQILCILLILTINVNPAGHSIVLNSKLYMKEAHLTANVPVSDGTRDYRFNASSVLHSISLQFGTFNLSILQELNITIPGFNEILNLLPNQVNLDELTVFLNKAIPRTLSLLGRNEFLHSEGTFNFDSSASIYRSGLSDEYMNIINSTALDSISLSRSLLSSESYVDDRFGAFIFNDIILWNVTVNWAWVRANKEVLGTELISFLKSANIITNSASQQNMFITAIWDVLPFDTHNYLVPLPSRYTIMHNTTSPHAIAAFNGELTQTAFRQCQQSKGHTNNSQSEVRSHSQPKYLLRNHPLPVSLRQSIEQEVALAVLTSIFIIFPLCYIPASFVSFLVKERVSKSKHLQIVSNVSPYLYWIATYTWDMFLFSFLVAFIIGTFIWLGNASRVFIYSTESTICMFLLLMLYGMSSIPLSYLYSMLFENSSTAQISIMVINFLTGFVFVLTYYVLILIPKTKAMGEYLALWFRYFPPYLIGESLINLSEIYYSNQLRRRKVSCFSWNVAGRNLTYMLLEAFLYFSLVLLTEFSLLRKCLYAIDRYRLSKMLSAAPTMKGSVDDDVSKEETKVEKLHLSFYGNCSIKEDNIRESVPDIDESVVELTHKQRSKLYNLKMKLKFRARNGPKSKETQYSELNNIDDEEEKEEEVLNPIHIDSLTDDGRVTTAPSCVLLIKDLVKTYPPSVLGGQPKHAVRGMSLACSAGERFGLLGINGAGKTTTLSVLTGDIQLSTGEVYICGKSLSDPSTMTMIGYCPQVDPLLELMNGYETLWFFGRIRNIPPDILRARVDALIKQVGLEPFAHKVCGSYSGGNKRKLSLAVALIGDPSVLLLDEVKGSCCFMSFVDFYSFHNSSIIMQ
jgi:ABC-type multidrug transport system ATPase subunit